MRPGAFLIAAAALCGTIVSAEEAAHFSAVGYLEAGREFEAERGGGAASGIELDAAFAHVGFDGEAGKTIFGASVGPRSLRGEVDFGPVLFDIDAKGFRAAAYLGREIAPGVFAGVYGAYQKETGDLESPFLTLGADLEVLEIAPFLTAFLPVGDGELEAGAALQVETGSAEIDLFPTERFTFVYALVGAGGSHPFGGGFTARGGAEARYIVKDDPILGTAVRDRFSVRFYGGVEFELDDAALLVLEGDVRAFQARTTDYTLTLRVARRF